MSMKMLFEQRQDTEIVQAMNGDEAVKTIQKNMVEFHTYKHGSDEQ